GAEAVAKRLSKPFVGAEDDAEQDGAMLACGATGESSRDELSQAVGDAAESAASADRAPAVDPKHDVNAVPPKIGPFVETVFRTTWRREHTEHVEHVSLHRPPAGRKLEEHRLGDVEA